MQSNRTELIQSYSIRFFDFLFSVLGLFLGLPVIVVLMVIGWLDTRSPIFRQVRVGRNEKPFMLLKFRTMKPDTPSVATHLASTSAVTSLGRFLRHTKLDEFPQLLNVLKGEMSLVGSRPCLFNQTDLIKERRKLGVFDALPGITGLAQIQGIDMSTPRLLAETDRRMLERLTLAEYLRLILLTILGKGAGDRIRSEIVPHKKKSAKLNRRK